MTSIFTSRKDDLIEDVKPLPEQKPGQQDNAPEQPQDNAPELGDTAVKWDRGKVLQLWDGNSSIYGVSSEILSIDNGSVDRHGSIYSISRDYSNVMLNTETYTIVATNPFSIVSSDIKGRQISLNISNMNTVENTYHLGAFNGGITDTIKAYNADNLSTIVEFNLISEEFSYDLSLSPDSRILSITIYQNFLEKVTIGSNDDMDYITLTGNKPLNVVINQIPGLITIELPRTKKLIDDRYVNLLDAKNIMYANLFYTADSTQIYFGLNDNNEYYIIEEGNNYTIMLPNKDKPFTPINPNVPEAPTQPEIPVVPGYPIGDQSNYELIIPNPAGLSVSQIKHEDMYNKLRFAIRIPGDYTSYLNINPLVINSNMINDVSIFLNSKYETEILVTTSKLQGYEITADADYIYINVGNPRDIYKNIVVLDPGHGGSSPGAIYNSTREKNINFKILYEIGKDLFNTDPSKLKVYYTRESDVDLSLAERAAFANKIGADLFVSLHMNANTNTSVYGTEIYYSNDNNKRNSAGLNSETFAKLFVNNLSSSLKTNNRGTRAAKYTVVHKNTVPAILVELSFMSNKNDFAKITNSTFQNEAAKAIYETLLMIFEKYPTLR
jgi:N-acetylmuramoyl-L-alanine amidase